MSRDSSGWRPYRFRVSGWACSGCSATNVAGTRFCGFCGTRRSQDRLSDDQLAAALTSLPDNPANARAEASPDVVEERRMVTSLFADVSGFTTLADMLEPEELHEVIAPVISGLAEIAERYEGFIAKYAGDALLVFFGAPVAHEDDAERALLVALEMHAALPSFVRELPEGAKDLTLHIGINTGRVVAGRFGGDARSDYSILGDAVIVAQRLESVSGPGDTYVGESTYELTKDRFRYESLGEMQLKGKLRAVRAWRLLGIRKAVAISGEGLDRPAFPMVGREEEMTAVWSMLDRLAAGRSGVVTICSEPGVGKSRLLREIREQAQDVGVRWYQGRSVSYGAGIAYHPWTDLIRQVTHVRAEDDHASGAERLVAALEGAAAAFAPFSALLGLSEDRAPAHPEAYKQAIRRGTVAWLRALSAKGPIVVAFEDLHWADASSLDLLVDLQRSLADRPVLFLSTARPEGADRLSRLRAAAAISRRIDLQPLDAGGIRELVQYVLGSVPPIELLAAATERSGGNPLFIAEIVRALQDRGDVVRVGGRWRMRPGWDAKELPDSVERVLASRIDMLPPEETNVIQLAAVVGRVVPLRLADRLVDQVADGRNALKSLVERRLLDRTTWVGEDAVMFSHALVQEVAYSRLLKRHRREMHRHVADTIEKEWGTGDEVVDLLARHLYLGEAGDAAMHALIRAGKRARDLYANEEAILHLGRAIEVAAHVGSADRREITLELAAMHTVAGHYDDALRLYEQVRDETFDIRGWRGIASVLRKRGQYVRALEVLDEAFAAVPRSDPEMASLWLERGWTFSLAGRLTEAIEALQAGIEVASDPTEPIVGELLAQLARAKTLQEAFDEAVQHGLASQEIFEARHDIRGLVLAMRTTGNAYAAMGRFDDAASAFRRALELAEQTATVEELAGNLLNLATVEMERGNLDEAIELDRRGVALFESLDHGSGQAVGYQNLADKLTRADNLEEAEGYCRRGLEIARKSGNQLVVAEILDTLLRIRAAQGRITDAIRCATDASEIFSQMGMTRRAAEVLAEAVRAREGDPGAERARTSAARARSEDG